MPRKGYFQYSKYEIRASDYELMFREQEGCCAICRKKAPKGKRLDIDHDHETGEVRGLLCGPCNRMLGLAYDNQETLLSAAKYIEEEGHSSRFYIEAGKLVTA